MREDNTPCSTHPVRNHGAGTFSSRLCGDRRASYASHSAALARWKLRRNLTLLARRCDSTVVAITARCCGRRQPAPGCGSRCIRHSLALSALITRSSYRGGGARCTRARCFTSRAAPPILRDPAADRRFPARARSARRRALASSSAPPLISHSNCPLAHRIAILETLSATRTRGIGPG